MKSSKLDLKIFIDIADKIHNNKYDYEKVILSNNYNNKITINCKEHGYFEQRISSHINGNGCKKCSDNLNTERQTKNIEIFLEDANRIHNYKYDYSLSNYISSNKKITIICNEHGKFEQTPNSHLNGHGCKKCGDKNRNKKTFECFLNEANLIHKNAYTYEKDLYICLKSRININCSIHGNFTQIVENHLKGNICPSCNNQIKSIKSKLKTSFSWDKDSWLKMVSGKECIFYILKCFNYEEEFIKIGITSKSIKKRYCGKVMMPYNFDIIKEIKGNPEYIWNIENKLKEKYKHLSYRPEIKFGGYKTECYSTNIINELNMKKYEKI